MEKEIEKENDKDYFSLKIGILVVGITILFIPTLIFLSTLVLLGMKYIHAIGA
jgi:hypothetical protein